jgi:hypothetical protein
MRSHIADILNRTPEAAKTVAKPAANDAKTDANKSGANDA